VHAGGDYNCCVHSMCRKNSICNKYHMNSFCVVSLDLTLRSTCNLSISEALLNNSTHGSVKGTCQYFFIMVFFMECHPLSVDP
jgi:hypothetical protein